VAAGPSVDPGRWLGIFDTLVTVAGLRWTIEENFQAGKGLTGLDEHQVRRWTSWYRWVTLAMLAAAVLTIAAAAERTRRQRTRSR
jgi:SRSO17 transposase